MALADIIAEIEATRSALAGVNEAVAELERERLRVVNAPPHTKDIIAVFQRNLSASAEQFKRQFAAQLAGTFLDATGAGAQAAGPNRSMALLTLDPVKADREEMVSRSLRADAPALNPAALAYFLRSDIADAIPELVRGLCPEAEKGMPSAERAAELGRIDAELATKRAESERLAGEIGAARAALRGNVA